MGDSLVKWHHSTYVMFSDMTVTAIHKYN
jgi:hypothetical protein